MKTTGYSDTIRTAINYDKARARRGMLLLHERAARAYAACGRPDMAAQAKAAAERTRAKIEAEG